MSAKKLRLVENLIMLTFPVVLFAGCAGSDVKPTQHESSQLQFNETKSDDQSFQAIEPEQPAVTQLKAISEKEELTKLQEDISANLPEKQDIVPSVQTATITFPQKKIFFFETNAHVLSPEQREELKQHADYLLANPGTVLEINGHADERGTEDYNLGLSEKRAHEAFQLLVEYGVSESQLLTKGFGEMIPMKEQSNWDENRRIELQYTDPVMVSSK